MAKYSEKMAARIVALIETDMYTITEICRALRIGRATFYEWKENNSDFRRQIAAAEDRRDEELLKIARKSLKKKLEGYTTLEEQCYYEPARSNSSVMILKKKVVKNKDVAPSLTAIKYVMEREEKKKKERVEKPENKPMIINVRDQHTAEQLLIFQKNLRGNLDDIKVEVVPPPL